MTDDSPVKPPATRPCASCPYRRDVPSGVWASEEYDKLSEYDAETPFQPTALFLCHQPGTADQRVCAGWAGTHDMDHSLALRWAAARGELSPQAFAATLDYRTDVPLFGSGQEAATHGMSELETPGPQATAAIHKIVRKRRLAAARHQENHNDHPD